MTPPLTATADFVRGLALRAATLDELLSDNYEAVPGQKSDSDRAGQRLAGWCRAAASGDWALFSRRLERDGLSLATVLPRLATTRRHPDAAAEAWLADACWVLDALQRPAATSGPDAGYVAQTPCAFEQLLLGLVADATSRLRSATTPTALLHVTASAQQDLSDMLLEQLADLCTAPLLEGFAKLRVGPPALAASGSSLYDAFIEQMRAQGLRTLFTDKPVLLRLIVTLVQQWLEVTRELLERFDADRLAIQQQLLHSPTPERLVRVAGQLSDPHNNGRSVRILTLESGAQIVYKPKDLQLDAAWLSLVDEFNQSAPPIDLTAVRVIARVGYGWTEFITHRSCEDLAGVERYFRRAGAWLAMFHAFAGTDMHYENLIAAGEQPIPIDLEMVLQAPADEELSHVESQQAFNEAARRFVQSVLWTGLLPNYVARPGEAPADVGGLNGRKNADTRIEWRDINSDRMRRVKVSAAAPPDTNIARLAGQPVDLGAHVSSLVSGFESYATFLVAQRDRLGLEALLQRFRGLPARRVVRPTRFYYQLLRRLKQPRTMEDGALWSAQIDFMARLTDWNAHTALMWPLQRAERKALAALNVPHFVSPTDCSEVSDEDGPAVPLGGVSGIESTRRILAGLDSAEIAWQSRVISLSTATLALLQKPAVATPAAVAGAVSDAPLSPSALLAEASSLYQLVASQAIRSGSGAAWLGLEWQPLTGIAQLAPLGSDLYSGTVGIAVFLAAYGRVSGDAAAAELARASIAGLRDQLRNANAARFARAIGIGGMSGCGSLIYALSTLAELLEEPSLLLDARLAAGLFNDELIAADKSLDIVAGSAGAILGLLRLYRASADPEVLRQARLCGDHLLAQPRVGRQGARSWIGAMPHAASGMSHGAAGFSYALAALAHVTGRDEYAAAARECIAFENASYDDSQHHWRPLNLANEPNPLTPCQWCHGAAGIGLARIGSLRRSNIEVDTLRQDVVNAVRGTEDSAPSEMDFLCCGTTGRVEFLLEAAALLERPDLQQRALSQLSQTVARATVAQDYRWDFADKRVSLGLMRGVAGIGYTLLRRLDASLPNVLLLE